MSMYICVFVSTLNVGHRHSILTFNLRDFQFKLVSINIERAIFFMELYGNVYVSFESDNNIAYARTNTNANTSSQSGKNTNRSMVLN